MVHLQPGSKQLKCMSVQIGPAHSASAALPHPPQIPGQWA